MSNLTILLLSAACLALTAAQTTAPGPEARRLARDYPLIGILPRFFSRLDNDRPQQQPQIIFLQAPNQNQNQNQQQIPPYFWPTFPSRPNQRPPFNYPGFDTGSDSGSPSIVIVNPNNMQGLYFPINSSSQAIPAAAAGGRAAGNRFGAGFVSVNDLLQSLSHANADDDESGDDQIIQPTIIDSAHHADNSADDVSEDELGLLERQAARGLSPKHLVALLTQDKQRKRFQEAAAGIYLKNFNLHK
ncbi:uncharacterized protein LOC115626556 [Scaptodrosophila lebanonensis]|uniref:Uncharacterized protein LOC115626556 n=1 Tax=Drosophila lebanonensis TaxID=7225 RepID=A0A6J2TQK9_DROLE|nr:uncharacterized protein LOC115626556 [Scaptodrosophila lebanonensis]